MNVSNKTLIIMILLLVGCKDLTTNSQIDALSDEKNLTINKAKTSSISELNTLLEFRNIFYSLSQENAHNQPAIDLNYSLFIPQKKALFQRLKLNSWNKFSKYLQTEKPVDFYLNSKNIKPKSKKGLTKIYKKKGKATFIIIPGIFGEFIKNPPITEVLGDGFREKTAFYKKYDKRFSKLSDHHFLLGDLKYHPQSLNQSNDLHLEKNQKKNISLKNYLKFGSIDRGSQSVVNIIYLDSYAGSLETFGTARDSAVVFNRRLNKVMKALDKEDRENVFLVGYSRGAVVGLEMLVTMDTKAKWYKNIKGFISYCGVILGSEMADEAYTPGKPSNIIKTTLEKKVGSLIFPEKIGSFSNIKLRSKNREIASEMRTYLNDTDSDSLPDWVKEKEGLDSGSINMFHIGSLLSHSFNGVSGGIVDFLLKDFHYYYRLKVGLREFLEGVESLTTNNRLNWWKRRGSKLPKHISYSAISGSMPGVSTKRGTVSSLNKSPYYGHNTTDYVTGLRQGYYDLTKASKTQLSDGQVTFLKGRFWPHLKGLNQPSNSEYLGMAGTHHWGVSWGNALNDFDFSFKNLGDKKANKYPRKTLIEALAIYSLEKI